MKTIKVVAAIICDDIKEKNKIFATARGYGDLKGDWRNLTGSIETRNYGRTGYRNQSWRID